MDDEAGHGSVLPPRRWVKGSDTFNLIVPEGHSVSHPFEPFYRREDIEGIPLDSEVAWGEGDPVIDVVIEHELPLELLLGIALPLL